MATLCNEWNFDESMGAYLPASNGNHSTASGINLSGASVEPHLILVPHGERLLLCGPLAQMVSELQRSTDIEMKFRHRHGAEVMEGIMAVMGGELDLFLTTMPPLGPTLIGLLVSSRPYLYRDAWSFVTRPFEKIIPLWNWDFLSKTFEPELWYMILMLPFIKCALIWNIAKQFRLWSLWHIYLGQGLDEGQMRALKSQRIQALTQRLVHVIYGWAIMFSFFLFTLYDTVMFDMLAFEPKWTLMNSWEEFINFGAELPRKRRECLKILSVELSPVFNYYQEMGEREDEMPSTRRMMRSMIEFYKPFLLDSIEWRMELMDSIQKGCTNYVGWFEHVVFMAKEYAEQTGNRPLIHPSHEQSTPLPYSLVYSPYIDSGIRAEMDRQLIKFFEFGLYDHWLRQALMDQKAEEYQVKARDVDQGKTLSIKTLRGVLFFGGFGLLATPAVLCLEWMLRSMSKSSKNDGGQETTISTGLQGQSIHRNTLAIHRTDPWDRRESRMQKGYVRDNNTPFNSYSRYIIQQRRHTLFNAHKLSPPSTGHLTMIRRTAIAPWQDGGVKHRLYRRWKGASLEEAC